MIPCIRTAAACFRPRPRSRATGEASTARDGRLAAAARTGTGFERHALATGSGVRLRLHRVRDQMPERAEVLDHDLPAGARIRTQHCR